jgi:hypothetical protein
MLVSDAIVVPHEVLADSLALVGSAVAYWVWVSVVFAGVSSLIAQTRMIVVARVVGSLLILFGLVGYFRLFVEFDSVAYAYVVTSAVGPPVTSQMERSLAELCHERARSILPRDGRLYIADARLVAFCVLPLLAIGGAAAAVRRFWPAPPN